MTTTDIQASGCQYLITNGKSASKWASGPPRKGIRDGNDNLSVILFDGSAIRDAVGSDTLVRAELVMTRDPDYGEALAGLTIVPMYVSALPSDYVTREDAIGGTLRVLHHNTSTEGSQAAIRLPGATLQKLAAGEANALMIYQEEDGVDTYVRFTGTPVLRLYTGPGWMGQTWTRPILSGDVISGEIYSHRADLSELQRAVNLRRRAAGLSDMADQSTAIEAGLFSGWVTIVDAMRTALNEALTHDGKPTVDWPDKTVGQMPEADVLSRMREAIGEDEADGMIESQSCFTVTLNSPQNTANVNSVTDGQAIAGTKTQGIETGGSFINVKIPQACGWLFDQAATQGMSNGKLKLAVKTIQGGGTVNVTLYGIKAAPARGMAYSAIYDTVAAGSKALVAGQEDKIELTADAVAKLSSGTYIGLGIGYTGSSVTYAAAATLLTGQAALLNMRTTATEGGNEET